MNCEGKAQSLWTGEGENKNGLDQGTDREKRIVGSSRGAI